MLGPGDGVDGLTHEATIRGEGQTNARHSA